MVFEASYHLSTQEVDECLQMNLNLDVFSRARLTLSAVTIDIRTCGLREFGNSLSADAKLDLKS